MNYDKKWKRTKYCGEIGAEDVGKTVAVAGWVQRSRDLGGLIFAQIRDRAGIVQAVFSEDSGGADESGVFEAAASLRSEYVIGIIGEVRERAPEAVNPNLATGKYEIAARELIIYNASETPPIYIEEDLNVNEATRFKYRYLDLRRPDMQRGLILRHRVAKTTRDFFDENGFLEIETPMLTKSTPEGARDYLVPSRVYPGRFFALPQSPQLFKQLLMTAGFDKYMQIARCFRDEDLRADRQPEFTQIDVEMSFVSAEDVMEINERFITRLFADTLGVQIKTPIPRMTYADAMAKYGSDKPDLRFDMEIVDVGPIAGGCGFNAFDGALAAGGGVYAINAKGCAAFSRKQIDSLVEYVRSFKARGLAWAAVDETGVRSQLTKFFGEKTLASIIDAVGAKTGDLVLIIADVSQGVALNALGQLRLELARRLGLIKNDAKEFKILWVTEFPLFEYDGEAARWNATHHPFTAPMDEDLALLETDPGKVRSKAYDLVINGMEAGGGSIRINDRGLQNTMFGLLGYSPEDAAARFDFLLEAFRYGVPPHGGIAYGLDRLVMILAGRDSIKDVVAFPKAQTSACAMTGAPSEVGPDQLEPLGIEIVLDKPRQ